jgi:hypothetical protein
MFLLGSIMCLYACHKDSLQAHNITGTWELRVAFGGVVGYETFSPGNGHTYTFNSDGTFTQYAGKGTLLNQGSFSIKTNAVQVQGVEYNELFLNSATSGAIVQVQDTTLSLGLNYDNETGGIYAKIK